MIPVLAAEVKQTYKKSTPRLKSLMADAGLTKDEVHEVLTNLFFAREVMEMHPIFKYANPGKESGLDNISEWLQSVLGDTEEVIKNMVKSAMTYRCYEPWDQIAEMSKITSEVAVTDEQIGKVIGYLYTV